MSEDIQHFSVCPVGYPLCILRFNIRYKESKTSLRPSLSLAKWRPLQALWSREPQWTQQWTYCCTTRIHRLLCSPGGQFEVALSNHKFPGVLTTTKTYWTAVSVAAMCWKKISQGYFRSQLSSCEVPPNTQCGAVGCAQITTWNISRPLFSAPWPKQHSVIIRFYVIWPLKLEESCQINQKQANDLFILINAQQLAPKPAVLQLRN
jgi:hypothetical protein